MAIINNHPTKTLLVNNDNSYLFNYLDTLGLDLEVHNDFADLKNVLINKEDYPYSFDSSFEVDTFTDTSKGFVFYLKDDDKIVATSTGWFDEHIHTELITSEGMNRIWSFQRSLINGMVTARDGGDVISYRMRHGGEGGP